MRRAWLSCVWVCCVIHGCEWVGYCQGTHAHTEETMRIAANQSLWEKCMPTSHQLAPTWGTTGLGWAGLGWAGLGWTKFNLQWLTFWDVYVGRLSIWKVFYVLFFRFWFVLLMSRLLRLVKFDWCGAWIWLDNALIVGVELLDWSVMCVCVCVLWCLLKWGLCLVWSIVFD